MPTINFEPIYTETINDVNVRFFVPPDDPAFSWVSYDDVAQSLGLSSQKKRFYVDTIRHHPKYQDMVVPIPTLNGALFTTSHSFVQGLSSAILKGQKLKQWHRVYSLAALSAVRVLTKDLTEVESFYYVMRAHQRERRSPD